MPDVTPWAAIDSLARLAPTPHNTQPFRIRPRDERSADIVALPERFLPREDHGNLYVASSFGILAAAMERAAGCQGYELSVSPRPDIDPGALTRSRARTVLGTATITGTRPVDDQTDVLDARRTSRIPYRDAPVDPAAISGLEQIAVAAGHRFIAYSDRSIVDPLLRLNAAAIVDNLQLDDERREIRGWYRLGSTPRYGDGLWQQPMNQPAWELWAAFAMPRVFALPGFKQFAIHRYLRTQLGTRHIGLLCGPFLRWPDLVSAGRMLMAFWLEMARHSVYMQPMGSMLTNPVYAAEIARRFGVDDCWLVIRFGYCDVPPRAPRLESILIDE